MDLRSYYQEIRKAEAGIEEPFVIVKSRAMAGGGRRGVMSEVPRAVAGRLLAEGKVELASLEEAARFRAKASDPWGKERSGSTMGQSEARGEEITGSKRARKK